MKAISIRTVVMFIFILILQSCKNQGEVNNGGAPVVNLDPGNKELSHENVMEIIDWVEIKADSSLFIGNAAKVEAFGAEYYIMDDRNQKCILRYTSEGKLKNKIGRYGDGPGEYSTIIDFSIDKTNSRIFILSGESSIYIYSTDGVFERKVKLADDIISKVSCNPKGLMASSGYSSMKIKTDGFLLSEFDNNFKTIGQWIQFTEPMRPPFVPFGADCLVTHGDRTYYFDDINLNVVVYDCNSNKLDSLMSFSMNNRMPKEIFNDNMRFITEQTKYNWVKDFVMTDSNVIVGYIYGGNYSITIIDRMGNIVTSGIYHGPFPQCYAEENDTIISPVPVDIYLNYWENQSGIIKPASDITDDTNLLIMKWKLRKL